MSRSREIVFAGLIVVCLAGLAPASAEVSQIYFTTLVGQQRQIRRIQLGPTQTVVSGMWNVLDMEVDPSGGKLYWLEQIGPDKLQRINLDGSCGGVMVSEPLPMRMQDFAIDIVGGKLYWIAYHQTGMVADQIRRANLDGSQIETLYEGTESNGQTHSITLDTINRKMYWVGGGVRRANLEIPVGETPSTRTDIEPVTAASSFALDLAQGRIYFLGGGSALKSCSLDGTDCRTSGTMLAYVQGGEFALDSAAAKLYWATGNYSGCGPTEIVRTSYTPDSIGVVESVACPTLTVEAHVRLVLAAPGASAGDMNGDGKVNGIDVQLFVEKLLCCP